MYGEKKVADDMLDFLTEFFKSRPDLATNDFFVTGEWASGACVTYAETVR